MRVDDEAHRLVGDPEAFERGLNFFGQGSELVVDQDDTVFADGGGDVASGAFQHVDIPGYFGGFDLDLGEILALREGKYRQEQQDGRKESCHFGRLLRLGADSIIRTKQGCQREDKKNAEITEVSRGNGDQAAGWRYLGVTWFGITIGS